MNLIGLYFNPSGRIDRPTFWLKGVLLLRLIWLVIDVVVAFSMERLIFNLSFSEYYDALLWDLTGSLQMLVSGSVGIHQLTGLIEALVFDGVGGFVIGGVDTGRIFAFWFIILLLSLIDTWSTFTVTVKRLHDTNRSAWWALAWAGIYLVGTFTVAFIVGWFVWAALLIWVLFWLGYQEGSPDRNRYGEPQQTTGVPVAVVNPMSHRGPLTAPSPNWMFQLSAIVSVISAGLVIVAAFLPWMTISAFFRRGDVSGVEGYTGIVTLLLGAAAGAIVVFGLSRQQSGQTRVIGSVACFLIGIAITVVAVLVITGNSANPAIELRAGLKMTLIGGIVLAVANFGPTLSLLFVPIGTRNFERRGEQPSGYGLPRADPESHEPPLPHRTANALRNRMKTCPYCAESIPNDEFRCRYCGSDISSPQTGATGTSARMKTCPYCAESIPYEELRCRYCDSDVPEEAD